MKRRDYVKLLKKNGWWLKRHGASHDIYTNGKDTEPVPRHSEIKEKMVKSKIKKYGLK